LPILLTSAVIRFYNREISESNLSNAFDVTSYSLAIRNALQAYAHMYSAREIDSVEQELVTRGEAFFQVSGAGHEATATLAASLIAEDFLHCHYRDKALLLARGVAPLEFFNCLICSGNSNSIGRQMSAHISAPALNILSIVGPVGNNALQAVGAAQQIKGRPARPIVVCSMGDGTTQQGEVLEAIAEAVRCHLPVLFLIQDNHYSISTLTKGKTFFSLPSGEAASFYGLPIHRTDGSDPISCTVLFEKLTHQIRSDRGPAICVLDVQRLSDHTNADDETVYRSPHELAEIREVADPVANLRRWLAAEGVSEVELKLLESSIGTRIREAAEAALEGSAAVPDPAQYAEPSVDFSNFRRSIVSNATMAEALRETLKVQMESDSRVSLYGEDIEDPKGDVFGITRGLSTAFPERVRNSPLAEATIVGTAIGQALAGGRPVVFLQFADFIPIAFNQIATELASMAWRTNNTWKAPVILMISCGAYRPGLGPFHAHTFESTLAHIPGLDVAMPSSAADASWMLQSAFYSERPTIILYPKAILHERSSAENIYLGSTPSAGKAISLCKGNDLTLVAWGNTVAIARQVAEMLLGVDVAAEVIDLRWLSPWDRDLVCSSVSKTRRLLVVHEDNVTGGFGAEVLATVAERIDGPIRSRRVARPDTFIPCNYGNQLELLPSFKSVLAAAAELLDLELTWEVAPVADTTLLAVPTIGASPADHRVRVAELLVTSGESVTAGQQIASLEGDKALIEVAAPSTGTVEQIHVKLGDTVNVGAPLLSMRLLSALRRQPVKSNHGKAHLKKRSIQKMLHVVERPSEQTIVLAGLGKCAGNNRLSNETLASLVPALGGSAGIYQRTGIRERLVADESQDVVSMSVRAADEALKEAGIVASDLSLIICSTTTPNMLSPSTACQILHKLAPGAVIAAYDISAACSGYLFGLANAWDHLQRHPASKVLLVTAEIMRRFVDERDPDTSPIFADAATASVLGTDAGMSRSLARIHRPILGAYGEDGSNLRVPLPGGSAHVVMNGKRIFSEAVVRMSAMIRQVCETSSIEIGELDMIVPHQANGRIIRALGERLKVPAERIWNGIEMTGNSSSSSIPLALHTVLRQSNSVRKVGLCAFGAGYTFGGTLIERHP
jgi:2-oxoisovalerate dehydrogenase E1 component